MHHWPGPAPSLHLAFAALKKPEMTTFSLPSRTRIRTIRKNLLRWYDGQKRDLPWRQDNDPYRVWISEIMLQQTRVEQAIPYFDRFIDAFPTVDALASRDLDQVLKKWEGLGYYSRARNIHAAAKMVCEEYGGYLPSDLGELQRLPGIGRYTAGAIKSIAYNEPAPAVDGNVVRVLSRLFVLDVDTKDAKARKLLEPLAAALVDRDRPGDFNQSLMELGATTCTPKGPSCQQCPLSRSCEANKTGSVDRHPRQATRRKVPTVQQIAVLAINEAGDVLMKKRPLTQMLGGLWEFPSIDFEHQSDSATALGGLPLLAKTYSLFSAAPAELLGTAKHAYSHFKVEVAVLLLAVNGTTSGVPELESGKQIEVRKEHFPGGGDESTLSWIPPHRIDELAITGLTSRIVTLWQQHQQ